VVLVEPDGSQATAWTVEAELEDNRFNDAKCDARGRLWAGTMSLVRAPGSAALYRIDGPEAEPVVVLDGLTIGNGLGWNGASDLMYYVDSPTQRIDMLDFDLATGAVAGRRPFAEIAAADGLPDGLAVDAEDHVWVALFGGGALRRYTPDGELDRVIALPVSNPTCPVFGGPALDDLYVTTARHRLPDAELARQPLAGAVLHRRPGGAGRAATPFAG
jgi:sugar lactone lactonase YvrE